MAVDGNEDGFRRRKRKRKAKMLVETGQELDGLDAVYICGEVVDLKFLMDGADGLFEEKLKEMTEGMALESELLDFLRGLEGQWGSSRKRRKLVDAAFFMKALPTNWKILLALRPRQLQPSLYCRRYVSPTGMDFKSCKDAALYLKAQFVEDIADSPGEGAMILPESGCQVDLVSVDKVPSSQNADADPQFAETLSTPSSFQNHFVDGEVQDCNPCREMVVVGDEDGFSRRKKKREAKVVEETGQELDGLDTVKIHGEVVDLKFLMHVADGLFEAKLEEMTEGKASENELLDFLIGLEGQWGSSRKRRKLVDAVLFMKALPANWKILLSLRPRHQHPSLYCRRYVSPAGIEFKSCKDAALYLKAQFVQDVADSPGEGAMILAENGGQVDLASQVDDVPSSQNTDADPQLPETKATSNSFQSPFVNVEVQDCNPCREMVVVGNENGFSRRKRKREAKMVEEMGQELDGLDTINIQGEVVDLKFLMHGADGLFEAKLRKMTEGKTTENELLDFLRGLEGQWGSSRKRRKLVDAAFFLKALPMNWKILLSLRPRHWRPSLYCRRYVSPSGIDFKSCKDVAFYLKAQFVENVADPPEEEPMVLIESGCEVEIISQGDEVPRSSVRGAAVGSAGIANLCNVPIYSLIECYICRMPFTTIGGLEQHLGKFHGTTTRRLDFNTLTGRTGRPLSVLHIRSPNGVPSATHKMDAPLQITEKSLEQNLGALEKETDPLQDTVVEFDEPRVNEAETPKDSFLNGHASLIPPEQSNEPKTNSEMLKRLPEVNGNEAKKPKVSTLNVQASSIVPVQSNDPKSKSEVLERVPLTDRKEAEKPKDSSLNGQTSWSLPEKSSEPEHNSKLLKKVPTTNTKPTKMCIWCLKEFIFRPVATNTPVGLPPSICPGCQLDIARDIEKARQKERSTVNVEGAKRHRESSSSDEIDVPPQIMEQNSGAVEEAGPFQDTVITHDDTRANDVQKPEDSPLNGQAASADEPKSDLVEVEGAPRNFKTKCMWCRQYFFREPVDAETMADSTGFMCPTCKEVTSGSLESTLSRMYPRADQ